MWSAGELREYFRFDIARLRMAAGRLQQVDDQLKKLRSRLEARAIELAIEADGGPPGDGGEDGSIGEIRVVTLRAAQAQATAELARRSALQEVLGHYQVGALPLIATMAVTRWIDALVSSVESGPRSQREALAKGHIDAGRIAHRMLATLRRRAGLRSGCGQLVCALVVAELSPRDLDELLSDQIEDGWVRALSARGVHSDKDAFNAVSAALREASRLLERMASQAEAACLALMKEESLLETRVKEGLKQRI